MENLIGVMFLGVIRVFVISIFVLFAIFGGEPDLSDGIIYWLSDGALK